SSDAAHLLLHDGQTVTINTAPAVKTGTASFSSSGPRLPDGHLKPDVTAPGQSIISAAVGTGFDSANFNGTSMATPHITGTAALVRQAHPTWTTAQVKAAIMNTGDPGGLADYVTHINGTGQVNLPNAVHPNAVAYADVGEVSLSFGVKEFRTPLILSGVLHVQNDGASSATFDVSLVNQQGSAHQMTVTPSQFTVSPHGTRTLIATLVVPADSAGDSSAFREVAGLIQLNPSAPQQNNGLALRVPYYLVPRVSSNVVSSIPTLTGPGPSATLTTTNLGSAIDATADYYSWGLTGVNQHLGSFDIRAVGAQTNVDGGDSLLIFAISTFRPWHSIEENVFQINVDTNGDGLPDFRIFNLDIGLLDPKNPGFSGEVVTWIEDLNNPDANLTADFLALTSTDSSTMLLPVLASSLGIDPAHPRISYAAEGISL